MNCPRAIGNAIYDVCGTCGQIVRVNKFVFGSAHVCLSDEEERLIPKWRIRQEAERNRRILHGMPSS